MSAAYALGVITSLPQAQISYDRFHVVALANEAMDEVRRNAATFINIAYLRMGKLTHLPTSPFVPAMPRDARHVMRWM